MLCLERKVPLGAPKEREAGALQLSCSPTASFHPAHGAQLSFPDSLAVTGGYVNGFLHTECGQKD